MLDVMKHQLRQLTNPSLSITFLLFHHKSNPLSYCLWLHIIHRLYIEHHQPTTSPTGQCVGRTVRFQFPLHSLVMAILIVTTVTGALFLVAMLTFSMVPLHSAKPRTGLIVFRPPSSSVVPVLFLKSQSGACPLVLELNS